VSEKISSCSVTLYACLEYQGTEDCLKGSSVIVLLLGLQLQCSQKDWQGKLETQEQTCLQIAEWSSKILLLGIKSRLSGLLAVLFSLSSPQTLQVKRSPWEWMNTSGRSFIALGHTSRATSCSLKYDSVVADAHHLGFRDISIHWLSACFTIHLA
jgi:hypothetical protein